MYAFKKLFEHKRMVLLYIMDNKSPSSTRARESEHG